LWTKEDVLFAKMMKRKASKSKHLTNS